MRTNTHTHKHTHTHTHTTELHEMLDGKEYVVEFDFLGKDSIRYYNCIPVDKQVFKNLRLFIKEKQPSDDLFDRLTVNYIRLWRHEGVQSNAESILLLNSKSELHGMRISIISCRIASSPGSPSSVRNVIHMTFDPLLSLRGVKDHTNNVAHGGGRAWGRGYHRTPFLIARAMF